MGDPAERYRATFALVIDCVVHMAPARPPSQAGGNRKADQRSCAGHDRDRRPRQTGQRAAGKQGGESQHPVAADAADGPCNAGIDFAVPCTACSGLYAACQSPSKNCYYTPDACQ